jgi:hypothetical protein
MPLPTPIGPTATIDRAPLYQPRSSGYIVLFNGTPISWHSSLQPVIALSTCEAEYVCCREVAYIRQLLVFCSVPKRATPAGVRGQPGRDRSRPQPGSPPPLRRTKHVDVKYHYIRQAENKGVVLVLKVPTLDNRADLFTKPPTGLALRDLSSPLMLPPAALVHTPR